MRIVALEEHVTIPAFNEEQEKSTVAQRGGRSGAARRAELEDVDDLRLSSMDAVGITMQVLSIPGPGAVLFSPEAGPSFAQRYNDALAAVARARPDRFAERMI